MVKFPMRHYIFKLNLVFAFCLFYLWPAFAQEKINDPHSFAEPTKVIVKHLDLNISVDFNKKNLTGKASWTIENNAASNQIIFDTRDLAIVKVTLNEKEIPAKFAWGKKDTFLGKALVIFITPETKSVNIYYFTSPDAVALQWLSPQQTSDKTSPFLFTQSQAILARSWLPCQDSPGIRFTYEADVSVPPDLLALMSASNPTQKNVNGRYHFVMDQPIPSYLMALAVGSIEFESLSKNTGVYAEPSMLKKVAWEFADIPKMISAAENLYGPYRWERYDVLVLPPSFPFGGMENPRLTFATPTVIAGDRSLVSLVAHELAHSWSGNLVTNATWDDFWLNEGFTVYFERRIDENLYGKDFTDMEWSLGIDDLTGEIADLGDTSRDTRLKLNLAGRDPDDGMTGIAYEKGALLLRCVEEKIGREKFDIFLKNYFSTYAFQSMTTEKFLTYLDKKLILPNSEVFKHFDYRSWIYGEGLPKECRPIFSIRFQEVDEEIERWKTGVAPGELTTEKWSTQEWLHFLKGMPEQLSTKQMLLLDHHFHFTTSQNSEIADSWYLLAIKNWYSDAFPAMEQFLTSVGRRKFLTPLYEEMMKTELGKKLALQIYKKARPNYHSVSTGTIDEVLDWKNNSFKSPY